MKRNSILWSAQDSTGDKATLKNPVMQGGIFDPYGYLLSISGGVSATVTHMSVYLDLDDLEPLREAINNALTYDVEGDILWASAYDDVDGKATLRVLREDKDNAPYCYPLFITKSTSSPDHKISIHLDRDDLGSLLEAIDSVLIPDTKGEDQEEKIQDKTDVEGDNVNHPRHYNIYKGIEIIDLAEQMNFNRGNAVKYIARAGIKNPNTEVEDLEKAAFYINREIARLKNK